MKIWPSVVPLLLISFAASAEPRDEALTAIVACRSITDPSHRLACLDGAAARAAAVLSPAGAQTVASPAQDFTIRDLPSSGMRAPQTSVESFGSESVASGGASAYPLHHAGDTVDSIFARLASYAAVSDGRITFVLDNGQAWRETGSGQSLRQLTKPAASYRVKISREGGASGSYTLHLSGMARTFFVRRVR